MIKPERVNDFAVPRFMNLLCKDVLFRSRYFAEVGGQSRQRWAWLAGLDGRP